jgi:hypothetical protein
MNAYHLTAVGNEWILTLGERGAPIAKYRSRDRALEEAIDITAENEGTLRIQRKDGTVAEGQFHPPFSYGLLLHPLPPPKNRKKKHRSRPHRRSRPARENVVSA